MHTVGCLFMAEIIQLLELMLTSVSNVSIPVREKL